MSDVMTVEKSR